MKTCVGLCVWLDRDGLWDRCLLWHSTSRFRALKDRAELSDMLQETLRQLHSICGRSHESLLADDVQQLVNYSIVKSLLQHTSTDESFIWIVINWPELPTDFQSFRDAVSCFNVNKTVAETIVGMQMRAVNLRCYRLVITCCLFIVSCFSDCLRASFSYDPIC